MTWETEFRGALEELTKSIMIETYERRLAGLMEIGGHRVRRLNDGLPNNRYNCFAYAVGVYALADYQRIADETVARPTPPVDASFMEHLIGEDVLTLVSGETHSMGDVVLYRDKGALKHAARIVSSNGLCQSKWGSGFLYEHGVKEVPSSYGDSLSFARCKGPSAVMDSLRRRLPR